MDALAHLGHDHADINRRVLAVAATLREPTSVLRLVGPLTELRDQLFFHFAREEEGLFPFVAETFAELAPEVDRMAGAHDTICGGLARLLYLATSTASPAALVAVFERFQTAYAEHHAAETALFARLDTQLAAEQRGRLAELIAGL